MKYLSDGAAALITDQPGADPMWDQAYFAELYFVKAAHSHGLVDEYERIALRSLTARLLAATDPDQIADLRRKLQRIYDRDFTRLATAPHVLDELRNDHQRIAFAAVAWRYLNGEWPRVTDLAAFITDRFGWRHAQARIERACDATHNEVIWIMNESWLLQPIDFDIPDDGRNHEGRVVIGAVAQEVYDLHSAYRRWAVNPIVSEVTR